MKNPNLLGFAALIIFFLLSFLFSCQKEQISPDTRFSELTTTKDPSLNTWYIGRFVKPNESKPEDGENSILRCPPVSVDLNSLLADGYYLWLQNYPDGTYTQYNEGDVPQVRCGGVTMRCDINGHGGGRFWLDGDADTTRRFGVSHYPNDQTPGMDLYEVYRRNGPHFVLRKDLGEGGLAYCTNMNGNANEGMQTGAVDAFFRDPNSDFFLADETNCLGATISLTKVDSTFTNNFSPYRFIWRNPQTDQLGITADVHQRCSVVLWRVDVSIETIGFECEPNAYFGSMRSQYLSDNTCAGSDDYILQAGEIQGQFLNN